MVWVYPADPGEYGVYAAVQMVVGFFFGYASGYARKFARLITSTSILFVIFCLQFFDHMGLVPMPWNFHQHDIGGQGAQDAAGATNAKHTAGSGAGAGAGAQPHRPRWRLVRVDLFWDFVSFLYKNFFVIVGVIAGWWCGSQVMSVMMWEKHRIYLKGCWR